MNKTWDEYEATLLLFYCLKVKSNTISRKNAISLVSEMLRQKALNAGREIDEFFRNENGIACQMQIMMTVLDNDTSSSFYHPSPMFLKVFDNYRNDNNYFQSVLNKSIKLCNKNESQMDSNFNTGISNTKSISSRDVRSVLLKLNTLISNAGDEAQAVHTDTWATQNNGGRAICVDDKLYSLGFRQGKERYRIIFHAIAIKDKIEVFFYNEVLENIGTLPEKFNIGRKTQSSKTFLYLPNTDLLYDFIIWMINSYYYAFYGIDNILASNNNNEEIQLAESESTPGYEDSSKNETQSVVIEPVVKNNVTSDLLKNVIRNNHEESIGVLIGVNPDGYCDYPVDLLLLSVRASNCLRRAQINTVSDLLKCSFDELLQIRNLGGKSAEETIDKLLEYLYSGDNEEELKHASVSQKVKDKAALTEMGMKRLMNYLSGNDIVEENFTDKDRELFEMAKESAEVIGNEMALGFLNLNRDQKEALMLGLQDFYELEVKTYELKRACEQLLSKVNPDLADRPVGPIVDAFLFRNKTGLYYQYLKDIDQSTRVRELIKLNNLFEVDSKKNKSILAFYKFLNTDLYSFNDSLRSYFEGLKENEREAFVCRAKGLTLEETGERKGVTRERVRQLEAKTRRKLSAFFNSCDIDYIAAINALHLHKDAINPSELKEFFDPDMYLVYLYYIKDSGPNELYNYSSATGTINFVNDRSRKDAVSYCLSNIIGIISLQEYESLLEETAEKYGISLELLDRSASVVKIGKLVSTSKPTKREIIDYILKNYFDDGYIIKDEDSYSTLCDILNNLELTPTYSFTQRAADAIVQEIGVPCDKGKWIHSDRLDLPEDFVETLTDYIDNSPYEAIAFGYIFDELFEYLLINGIENRYCLRGALKKVNLGYSLGYYLDRDYIYKPEWFDNLDEDGEDDEYDEDDEYNEDDEYLEEQSSHSIAQKSEVFDRDLEKSHPGIYKKVYSVSKIYDEKGGHSLEEIMRYAGGGASPDVFREILDNVSWARKIGADIYTFSFNDESADVGTGFNKDNIIVVLTKRFSSGITLDSIDLEKFRSAYESIFDEELDADDESLTSMISQCGLRYKGKTFSAESIIDLATQEKLTSYINNAFALGKKVIYYKAIYSDMENDFICCFNLADEIMLREYIRYVYADKGYYFYNDYMTDSPDGAPDIAGEIADYLISMGKPMTHEEIYSALSHFPKEKIYHELMFGKGFVANARGECFHRDIFQITDDEKEEIRDIISSLIDEDGFAIWADIYKLIVERMPIFIDVNSSLSSLGIRKCVESELIADFDFSSNIISKKGDNLSLKKIFERYARSHETFSFNDLVKLADTLKSGIYYDTVANNSVRVSHDLFVSKRNFQFDVQSIDDAIETYMVDDFIPVKEVDSFLAFPTVGFEWNEYLLEAYLLGYSKRFILFTLGRSNIVSGVICKKIGKYRSFVDVCAAALAESGYELTQKAAFDYLVEKGFLARRAFADIDIAIKKAQKIRNGKE